MRTLLEETLMGSEVYGTYRVSVYDKTATAYMFGYACSSGFGSGSGSGFGRNFGVGTGFVFDTMRIDRSDLTFRLRADFDNRLGSHLNDELLGRRDTLTGRDSHIALENWHHQFDWKK